MRLGTVLVGLLAIISLVLSGTVYAGFALHKESVVDAERQSLGATAQGIAETVETSFEEKRRTVELGAAHPETARFGTDGPRRAVERFVDRTEFDGASVVAADGRMQAIAARDLAGSRREALVGADFGDRAYVERALGGDTFVGEPFAARSGNFVLVVSTPVRRDGRVVGTFNGAVHLRRSTLFSTLSRSLEPGQRLEVRRGNLTAYQDGPVREPFLVETREAGSRGWTVTVSQSRASVEDLLWRATFAQFGAVAVAILSVALVGGWVYRAVIGRLTGLIDGLAALEAGDYDRELDLGVTDEWSHISAQFDTLAATLDQRESQLRVMNRVLRHNLRNDMSVIVGYADAIIHDAGDDEPVEEAERIRRTAHNLLQTSEHARAIYDELLGDGDLAATPVDAAEVVASEAARLRGEFPESTVETTVPETAPTLDSDALPIVVDELTRNALLHNDLPPSERTVRLAVAAGDDGVVRLCVGDNGPGMPDVEADLLTGTLRETSIEHGSGLGLWLVNWLVRKLDGEVSVATSGRRGTVVTVRLPAAPEYDPDA